MLNNVYTLQLQTDSKLLKHSCRGNYALENYAGLE
jgi:hypothetical protein